MDRGGTAFPPGATPGGRKPTRWMNFKAIGFLFRDTFREWRKDNTSHLAAALAFYSLLSLAPVVLIVIAMSGLLLQGQPTQGEIIARIRMVAGAETAAAIRALVETSGGGASHVTATLIGVVTLLLGATAVFADLQGSLNAIWKAAPKARRSLLAAIESRFLSFLMVLGIGLFLLASLGLTAAITALERILGYRPELPAYLWPFLHGAVSWIAVTILFAMIYKILPDVRIMWSDVWIGAIVTSVLFTMGKWIIGFFLEMSLVGSIYGKAGSLIAFLIWIYFSAQIFFLGAEFTHVYAEEFGSRIIPSREAEGHKEEVRAEKENAGAGNAVS